MSLAGFCHSYGRRSKEKKKVHEDETGRQCRLSTANSTQHRLRLRLPVWLDDIFSDFLCVYIFMYSKKEFLNVLT